MPKQTTQPKSEDESFGARLIRYRTAMNLGRVEFAEILVKANFTCSKETIYNWECRGQTPRGDLYLHIVQKLKKAGY